MQDSASSKAVGADRISRFMKDCANILVNQSLLFVIYQSPEETFQMLAKSQS